MGSKTEVSCNKGKYTFSTSLTYSIFFLLFLLIQKRWLQSNQCFKKKKEKKKQIHYSHTKMQQRFFFLTDRIIFSDYL